MTKFFAEQRLLRLASRGHRHLLIGGILASGVNAAGTIALIGFVRAMIEADTAPTLGSGLLLLGLLGAILVSHVAAGSWVSGLGALAVAGMRRQLAAAVTATDYEHIERIGPHRIYAAFAEDLPRIAMAYSAMPTVLLNGVITACGLTYLGFVSWHHLLIMLALVGLALAVSERVLLRQMKLYSERLRARMDSLYKQIQALVYGSKEMKLNRARETFFRDRLFEREVEEIYRCSRRREFFISVYNGWSASIALLLLAGILWLNQYWVPMERGQMIAFALVLMFLRGPVIAIVNNVPHLTASNVALKNIRELKLSVDQAPDRKALPSADAGWREIVLDAVGYRYCGDDGTAAFELAPLSLTINRGEVVYITGGNGSGKSTLAKLIVGLYRPTAGSMRVGDVAVTPDNLAAYRAHFSAIFGDYFLFEAVLGGTGELLADAAIQERLSEVGLGEKVQAAKGAFSTLALSQGQRKRLALIIALAEDRPVLLFDEWAAEQDPEFRRRFYCEIIPALKAAGKTIVAITHDEQYFHTADRIVRLDQGQLQLIEPQRPRPHPVRVASTCS